MSTDSDFDQKQKLFATAILADPASYGMTNTDTAQLSKDKAAWEGSYAAHVKAQADAETATQKKDLDKGQLAGTISGLTKKARGTPGMTDDKLKAAAVNPHATARTSIGAPTTRPLGRYDILPHLTVVLHFVDESTPQRTAKPAGVHGCEIWSFLGTAPPASPSGYAFLALDTRTPYTDKHDPADAGKTVYYLLRWQNHKGEPGPWSEVITVKLPA